MDGISRLREAGSLTAISLRELAEDLAEYVAVRPESAAVLDALASYLSDLHPATASARPSATALRHLLPGEQDAIADVGADPERWVNTYQHLVDAADVTGLGIDVQVHLLSRLAYWQSRRADADLVGSRVPAIALELGRTEPPPAAK